MSKRSNTFERAPRDFYPTPPSAVAPLIGHLPAGTTYAEPCAGDGALIRALESLKPSLTCLSASDIDPQVDYIDHRDALSLAPRDVAGADVIITNPPWDRTVLHPMIEHFGGIAPTWLLFDADWIHTKQSAPYIPHLQKIVSVGRVKWFPDSPHSGKDNCAWHLFTKERSDTAQFIGRAA